MSGNCGDLTHLESSHLNLLLQTSLHVSDLEEKLYMDFDYFYEQKSVNAAHV